MCHHLIDSWRWLENKVHLTVDSCHLSSECMHYIGNEYHTAHRYKSLLLTLAKKLEVKDSIEPLACFHAASCMDNQAAFKTNTAFQRTSKLYLFINFDRTTELAKNLQSFVDWRTKQKPSQRAGFVITAIKDSPGLIRGRLEPQRGRSLTVKAVCGGTLGWKDPPFNSVLALPGATHQDPKPK